MNIPRTHLLRRWLILPLLTLSLSAQATATPPGDRHPTHQVEYPAGAFYHNGGRIIDVTKPPFNARGDGKTDDTAALIKAYDFVAEQTRVANDLVQKRGGTDGPSGSILTPVADSYVMYFPAGEYLISDTLIYSGDPILWKSFPGNPPRELEALTNVRFIGENRERTIIRLRDHAAGFEAGKEKAVISLSKVSFNNIQTTNVVSHLTIDTGSGNPGAIGISHAGANQTNLRDLTIRSGDGDGVAGIAILTNPTMGYHCDITIEGFRTGIWMFPFHMTHNSFEYVTLRGQREVAIALDDSTTSLRKILVEDSGGPALLLRGPGSLAAVVESSFKARSGSHAGAAISAPKGSIFARHIDNSGYHYALSLPDTTLPGGAIDEFVFPSPFTFPQGKVGRSLELPVEDEPVIPLPAKASDWAFVDDYIAAAKLDPTGDVSSAVQAAMDSGKAHVLFGKYQQYQINHPVNVPAKVVRIDGAFTRIEGNKNIVFVVKENAPTALVLENFIFKSTSTMLVHSAPRTLWLSNLRSTDGFYTNKNRTRTRLFLTNIAGFGKRAEAFSNQDVWARWINTESSIYTNFEAVNSNLWVLGYKTEKHRTNFAALDGSKLEVLGGMSNQYNRLKGFSPFPAFIVTDSSAYVFGGLNGPDTEEDQGYKTLLSVQLGKQHYDYLRKDAPRRPGRAGQYFISFSVNPPPAEKK